MVKAIAARKGCSVEEAVYLYNLRPQDDLMLSTAPINMLYQYHVRVREVYPCEEFEPVVESPYQTGDAVWVKPPRVRCDEQHREGVVTRVLSHQAVEVDRVPRHVKDLHLCTLQEEQAEGSNRTWSSTFSLMPMPMKGKNSPLPQLLSWTMTPHLMS